MTEVLVATARATLPSYLRYRWTEQPWIVDAVTDAYLYTERLGLPRRAGRSVIRNHLVNWIRRKRERTGIPDILVTDDEIFELPASLGKLEAKVAVLLSQGHSIVEVAKLLHYPVAKIDRVIYQLRKVYRGRRV